MPLVFDSVSYLVAKQIMKNRSLLCIVALIFLCVFNVNAQSTDKSVDDSKDEMSALCAKAGFEIKSKSSGFDVYKYQKAFLNFDRIDKFRKEKENIIFSLENGEATVTLYSADFMVEKYDRKSNAMGEKLPPLRFVLNVNGQVKEQPLN
jgi:hypothetical protein